MTQELAGKVAIITGGSKGIGRGVAEVFVREGASIVIADVDEPRGAELAERLGPAARFRRADVSSRDEVEALVAYAVSEFGGLHCMFNNAGVTDNSFGRLLDEDFRHFDPVMKVNVLGVMLGTQIAARHMAENGGGSIINISSIGGVTAGHGFPTYRAAKAAVIAFTKSAAIDLGEHLIRVNCICPGNIPTEMGAYAHPEPGMTQAQTDQLRARIAEVRLARQPLKRQGEPSDIAEAGVFLASDRSRYVSGQVLSVDGAASAGEPRSLIEEIMQARRSVTGG